MATSTVHFGWQAWHFWHWTGSGGALGSQLTSLSPRLFAWQAWHLATSTVTLRGRRHGSSLCMAGVALMALGWLWWRAWFPFGAVGAAAVCVAGVALGDIDRAKTGHCHSPILMVLACQFWLQYMHTCIHTCIHRYERTYVHTHIRAFAHPYILLR